MSKHINKHIYTITNDKVIFIFDEKAKTFTLKSAGILLVSEINAIYRFAFLDIPKRYAATFDKTNKPFGDFLARCYLMRGGIIPSKYARKRKKIEYVNNTLLIPFR